MYQQISIVSEYYLVWWFSSRQLEESYGDNCV